MATLLQADARALPFADDSFDFIFASPPWDALDVFEESLKELRRVCSPRGRHAFILPNLDDPEQATLALANAEMTHRMSYICPKPTQVRGNHYFSPDEGFVSRVLKRQARKGARVLDPFCGTGTIPRVAERMGFPATGCDIDGDVLAHV